jgi:hypothetical protein
MNPDNRRDVFDLKSRDRRQVVVVVNIEWDAIGRPRQCLVIFYSFNVAPISVWLTSHVISLSSLTAYYLRIAPLGAKMDHPFSPPPGSDLILHQVSRIFVEPSTDQLVTQVVSQRVITSASDLVATMSTNLDKSLDDLVGSRRQSARRRGSVRRAATNKPSVGGVKKSTKAAPKPKPAHPAPAVHSATSKILVSGLVCIP